MNNSNQPTPSPQLTDAELLAQLVNCQFPTSVIEICKTLLLHYGGLQGLAQLTLEEFQTQGLNEESALHIMTALEIGVRFSTYRIDARPIIKNADDAANLMLDMRYLNQEHIRVILLDNARRVIAVPTVYIGTVNAAILRTAEIYREAIIRNAPALILVHNHPSGNASPSPEDVQLTQALIQAGNLLDIVFVDHLIIGAEDWCSLKELRLGF